MLGLVVPGILPGMGGSLAAVSHVAGMLEKPSAVVARRAVIDSLAKARAHHRGYFLLNNKAVNHRSAHRTILE